MEEISHTEAQRHRGKKDKEFLSPFTLQTSPCPRVSVRASSSSSCSFVLFVVKFLQVTGGKKYLTQRHRDTEGKKIKNFFHPSPFKLPSSNFPVPFVVKTDFQPVVQLSSFVTCGFYSMD
ncbi:MAG: hypothetical protein JW915_01500 [Chitinispirillaceae bacterium]|nr:hypothetical protein [Chitinispirillaceae bacterium]